MAIIKGIVTNVEVTKSHTYTVTLNGDTVFEFMVSKNLSIDIGDEILFHDSLERGILMGYYNITKNIKLDNTMGTLYIAIGILLFLISVIGFIVLYFVKNTIHLTLASGIFAAIYVISRGTKGQSISNELEEAIRQYSQENKNVHSTTNEDEKYVRNQSDEKKREDNNTVYLQTNTQNYTETEKQQSISVYLLLKKAGRLLKHDNPAEAVAIFDEIIQRYAISKGAVFARQAKNLITKANELEDLANEGTSGQNRKEQDAIESLIKEASKLRKQAITICKEAESISLKQKQEDEKNQKLRFRIAGGILTTIVFIVVGIWFYFHNIENELLQVINDGKVLIQKNKFNEAYALVNKFNGDFAQNERIIDSFAEAIINHSTTLYQEGNFEEALTALNEITEMRFGNNNVTNALIQKGIIFEKQGNIGAAMSAYVAAYKSNNSESLDKNKDIARFLKLRVDQGLLLSKQNKSNEAIAIFDEIINNFGGYSSGWSLVKDNNIAEQLVRALSFKTELFDININPDKSISIYADIAKNCGEDDSLFIKETIVNVVKALFPDSKDKLSDFDDFIKKIVETGNPHSIEGAMIAALLYRAENLIKDKNGNTAIAIYDGIGNHFRDAEKLSLYKKAILLGRLGKIKEQKDTENKITEKLKTYLDNLSPYLNSKDYSEFKYVITSVLVYIDWRLSEEMESREDILLASAIMSRMGIGENRPYSYYNNRAMAEISIRNVEKFAEAMRKIYADESDSIIKKILEQGKQSQNPEPATDTESPGNT